MLIARSALGEVARNFLASLTAITGAVFFMLAITFMKRTPGVGLGFLVDVFPLFFPLALQFTVPLAVLAATVMAFSRMAADGEITALNASGVPLLVIARPVLAGAALVALTAFLLTDVTAPFAAARLRAAKRDLIHQIQTSFRAGLRDLDLGRGRISFESFRGSEFTDVCVEWRRKEGAELWRAKRGWISVTKDDRVVLELRNAQQSLPRPTPQGDAMVAVGDIVLDLSLPEIVGERGRPRKRSDLTAGELAYVAWRGVERGPGVRIYAVGCLEELARRTALAASAFFFALIAIPLGIWSARGGKVGAVLLGIGPVLLLYFPLVLAGSSLARHGRAPAFPALWSGNLVLLVAGSWLLWRRSRR